VVILPVNGPVTLVVDIPWWRDDLVVADDVRQSIDVTETVRTALRDAGLGQGRLGLVGASLMSAAAYLGLLDSAPSLQLVRQDNLIERLRMIKSPAERELLRRAAAIGSEAMEAIMDRVVQGSTEADAVRAGFDVLTPAGANLHDASCGSGAYSHHWSWARLPSYDAHRRLKPGDMFHIDHYGAYGGYFWDIARTRVVGDQPTEQQLHLLEATIGTVEYVCSLIKPGVTAGELAAAGASWLRDSEAMRALPEIEPTFPLLGHSLGLYWEDPWLKKGETTVLQADMCMSVELFLGDPRIGGAQFEQNGFVTGTGFEVLTSSQARWWQ
jgi:Xaa-Pro aminopeptidase